MSWKQQLVGSGNGEVRETPAELAKVYDAEKETGIPVLRRDAVDKPFEPISFQPVTSTNIYEAEFGVTGKDVVFHFWPYNFHLHESVNKIPPRFPKHFPAVLKKSMEDTMSPSTVQILDDREMGAWFVRVVNLAEKPFHRELSIKACEAVHSGMGGKSDS
jgi:hypothetical protein